MIASKSQIGRLCSAAELPLALPTQPLYSFDAARDAALARAVALTASRPWLREDAEQAALLAAWEATSGGTREVEFDAIEAEVRRAVRDCIDDLTEKRREAAETPAYTVDYAALLDEKIAVERQGDAMTTTQRLRRLVDKLGVEAIVQFTRYRYGSKVRFSARGAGAKCGVCETDARELDIVLRRVNPSYAAVIKSRRAARKRRRRRKARELNAVEGTR